MVKPRALGGRPIRRWTIRALVLGLMGCLVGVPGAQAFIPLPEDILPGWSWHTTSFDAEGITSHRQCMTRLRYTMRSFRNAENTFIEAHETDTTLHLTRINGADVSALLICSKETRVVVIVVHGTVTAEQADALKITLRDLFRTRR